MALSVQGRRARAWMGVALGGGAMAVALWGVPLGEVAIALRDADLRWLVVVAAIFLCQQALRAWRQAVLVRAVHRSHTFRTSHAIVCIGFFFINILPARMGEVVRPALLLEREEVPLGTGFAVIVVERVVDLCAMFVMLGATALLVPVQGAVLHVAGHALNWMEIGRTAATVALPTAVFGLAAAVFAGPRLLCLLAGPARRDGLLGRGARLALRFGQPFVEGLMVMRSGRRLASVLALTAAAWGVSGLMYPAMGRCLGLGELITYGDGIGILGITMLGMTVPSAPGFAGTYEAFVRGALALFGVAGPGLDARAVAFALALHWWVFLVQASTAVWFLAVDRVDVRRLWRLALCGLSDEAPDPAP